MYNFKEKIFNLRLAEENLRLDQAIDALRLKYNPRYAHVVMLNEDNYQVWINYSVED